MTQKVIEWIYVNNEDDSLRYALGQKGHNMIACIGLNPSTAKPGDSDQTIRAVEEIAHYNGYNGWIMFNLSPKRETHPEYLAHDLKDDLLKKNVEVIEKMINQLNINEIWAAWGDAIDNREYFSTSLNEIYKALEEESINWKSLENLNQSGHPKHPSRKSHQSKLVGFDIKRYIKLLLDAH